MRELGADLAFDTVGGTVFQQSFAAVRPYGDVVTLLQPGADTDWKVPRLRNQRTSLERMRSLMCYGWNDALRHQSDILTEWSTAASVRLPQRRATASPMRRQRTGASKREHARQAGVVS